MLDQVTAFLNVLIGQSGVTHMSFGNVVMIAIGAAMIAVATAKRFEPLLLAGIGFACIIASVPVISGGSAALSQAADGGLFHYAWFGIAQLIIPALIFLGIGAMTDFGAVIANPKLIVLGAGAQLGIFAALILAKSLGFTMQEAGAIGILGAADGPIALFVTSKLAPHLLGPVSVVAYASTALMFMMQPRAMRLLTSGPERHRAVTKLEKIAFPIVIALIFSVLLPQIAPLMVMLMLGNLLREVGPTGRVSKAALGMTKVLTVVLAVAIGSSMAADSFLTVQTAQVIALAVAAFACAAGSTVVTAKLMNLFLLKPISPPIAHFAPAHMVKRGFKIVAQHETSNAILVHHAMGQNLAGVFGAAISGAIILAAFGASQPTTGQIALGVPDSALAFSALAFLLAIGATVGIGLILAALPLLDRLEPVRAVKIRLREKPARVQGEADAIPEDHIAAISATLAATIGQHRIVHIEPAHNGLGWQAEGRAAHHGSHAIFHPGASQVSPTTKEIAMERKFKITVDGREYSVTVEEQTDLDGVSYFEPPISFPRSAPPAPTFAPAVTAHTQATLHVPGEPGDVVSTLGGVVESLLVTIGQEIKAGDRVIVIEAMKMKTPITAHQGGKVADVLVDVGDGVQTGQVLVKLT